MFSTCRYISRIIPIISANGHDTNRHAKTTAIPPIIWPNNGIRPVKNIITVRASVFTRMFNIELTIAKAKSKKCPD